MYESSRMLAQEVPHTRWPASGRPCKGKINTTGVQGCERGGEGAGAGPEQRAGPHAWCCAAGACSPCREPGPLHPGVEPAPRPHLRRTSTGLPCTSPRCASTGCRRSRSSARGGGGGDGGWCWWWWWWCAGGGGPSMRRAARHAAFLSGGWWRVAGKMQAASTSQAAWPICSAGQGASACRSAPQAAACSSRPPASRPPAHSQTCQT